MTLANVYFDEYKTALQNFFKYVQNKKKCRSNLNRPRIINYHILTYDIKKILLHLNSINKSIQFTIEKEIDSKLNFLDLLITREDNNFSFNIYRKETYSNAVTIILIQNQQPFIA